jgi:NADH-quinone oxidoreductase subunit E
MMQINEDYFEDIDKEKAEEIIEMILNDRSPKPGSYKNRRNSEPISGRTTLTNSKDA